MPSFYDIFYFRGLFQFFRVAYDMTLGNLPFPSIYIIVPAFFGYFLWSAKGSKLWLLKALGASLIWVVVLFYTLWGFNYTQPSLYRQLEMASVSVDSSYIAEKFKKQTLVVEQILANNLVHSQSPSDMESKIRVELESLLNEWNFPTAGKVRVRKIPKGSLLHFRTSGIYIPHALEGHLDKGLYYRQHPFTMAHEMAHGYGITDESACNFIAYLVCQNSKDQNIFYSGELAYWRYLAKYYKAWHKDAWDEEYASLSPRLQADLVEIRNHIERYKDLMPKYRDVIYDSYLKSHGVSAGIKSYDEMIMLIAAYQQKYK